MQRNYFVLFFPCLIVMRSSSIYRSEHEACGFLILYIILIVSKIGIGTNIGGKALVMGENLDL